MDPRQATYSGGLSFSSPNSIYNQDPNKVVTSIGGVNYNYAGDIIKPQPAAKPKKISSIYDDSSSTPVAYAPYLDVAGTLAKARKQAEKSVNPFYTKTLNDFLGEQKRLREAETAQYKTDVAALEQAQSRALEQTGITRGRTAEDVAQNVAELGLQEDQFQTDTGEQFDQDRLQQARQQAASGVTGGLAAQQVEQAEKQRNVQEERQVKEFQTAKDQQQLFKNRTFDDLTRADKQTKEDTATKKKQEKFDLDNYIKSQKYNTKEFKRTLEKSRLDQIKDTTGTYARSAYNRYLAGIADPLQIVAASQKYGSSF